MKRIFIFPVLLILSMLHTGCFQHFFRTNTRKNIDTASLQKLLSAQKYFIVHFSNGVMALNKIKIADDKLEADLIPVPKKRMDYIDPKPNKTNSVRVRDRANTIMEVHLYYSGILDSNQAHLFVPVSTFNRMDVYEFDKKSTNNSIIFSIVGIAAVGYLVVHVIGGGPFSY